MMPRRRRRVSRLQIVYAAVTIALMLLPSIALDRSDTEVTAQITAKHERIVVGAEPSGDWDRQYEVAAAFDQPAGGRWEPVLRVPAAHYDALHTGDSIAIRYLRQFPAIARTSDRSTATVIGEFARRLARLSIVVWLVAGAAGFWIAARLNAGAVIAMAIGWAVAAWPMFFMPPSREQTRPAQHLATVRNVTLVDRSPARLSQFRRGPKFDRRLAVPYQVVELLVATTGVDTVLAVDAIDSGSVAGLTLGARFPVRLDLRSPRDAQLVSGTRRFSTENRYHFLVPVIGCVILATFAALGYRRRRANDASPTVPRVMASRVLPPDNLSIIHRGGA